MTKRIVFFTGAGISVPSGLPTYRGTNGIYTKNPELPQQLTYDNWLTHPEVVLEATARMRELVEVAAPNPAHLAIAKLEENLACNVVVVTQNVDNLHTAAGSTVVHELHGNLFKYKTDPVGTRSTAVLFGENLDGDVWDAAEEAVQSADVVVAVGTSGDVIPAAYLLDQANENAHRKKCKFYYLSLDPPERYLPFPEKLYGSAEVIVPYLCKHLSNTFS